MNQLVAAEIVPFTPAPMNAVTPMAMLSQAVAQGAPIEVLERLMVLANQMKADHNREAFDAAVSEAKAEIPAIVRNAKGHNDKRYANFDAIARAVDPVLSKHGLGYRFRTAQTDKICVTCILFHRAGHFEETTLCGPADTTGSKNAIQAIGSTQTYLQRYTLVAMLGLAATDDDDGSAAGLISEEQLAELQSLIVEVGADIPKFCAFMKVETLADIPFTKYAQATTALAAKRAKS